MVYSKRQDILDMLGRYLADIAGDAPRIAPADPVVAAKVPLLLRTTYDLFVASVLGRDFPPGYLQTLYDLPWPLT